MILYPFYAFVGGLKLTEVIIRFRICAHDCGHHSTGVNDLLVNDCADPAGCAAVDMCVTDFRAARAHTDERRVSAAAEYRGAGGKTEFGSSFFGNLADFFGAFFDLGQMPDINADHVAYGFAPAFVPFSCIIKKCGKCAVPCHNEFTACAADQVFFNVKPFVNLFEYLRLMCFYPFIFPNGVFNGRTYRSCIFKIFKKLCNLCAGDLNSVSDAVFQFLSRSLIHITHWVAHAVALFVHKNKALHL